MTHGLTTTAVWPVLAGAGLTWLLQSSALLALGLLAGRVLKRSGPAVQSAVYRTTLAAVLVCPIASALLSSTGFDGFTLRLPAEVSEALPPQALTDARPAAPALAPAVTIAPLVVPAVSPQVPSRPPEPLRAPTPVSIAYVPRPALAARPIVAFSRSQVAGLGLAAWVMVSALLMSRLAVGQWRMSRLRAASIPAEPDVKALCADLAERLRLCPPEVLCSPFLFSPCLFGIRHPAILLPEDGGSNLHETFVHELAHLARRDGHWNLLRHCAVAALWFQPLLWVLSRRLETAAEEVCDDYVVHFGADRARYAGHLLALAGRALPPAAPAGVGMITLRSMLARRIVRILDPSRRLSTRAGTRAVLAMLAAGLAGTLLAGLLGVGGSSRKAQAQSEAQAPAEPAAAKPQTDDDTIRGRVVGPDGKPVAGATVVASRSHLPSNVIGNPYRARKRHELIRASTDAEGRFAIRVPTQSSGDENDETRRPDPRRSFTVIATAPGFGLGYLLGDGPIRLAPAGPPVAGRLVDLEGRPFAGAQVRLLQLQMPSLDARPEKNGASSLTTENRLYIDGEAALPGGVKTNADGRFRIEGLGRDVLVTLEISGSNVSYRWVHVATREMDRTPGKPPTVENRGVDEPGIFGADCTIVVEPSRPIEGVVRDLNTGEPIAGAVVTAGQLSGSILDIEGMISATTDDQGHYRLTGLPKADGHKISVYPPLDRPYFVTRFLKVAAGPGVEPVRFDIALRSGLWITGKVSDATTAKPLPAAVAYLPFLANEHARDYPNFDAAISMSIDHDPRYHTDRAGAYRLVGLPGQGVVLARSDRPGYRTGVGAEAIEGRTQYKQLLVYDRVWPDRYHALTVVNPAEDDTEVRCDLRLDPGRTLTVRLVDPEGAPLLHVAAHGRYPELIDDNDRSLDDGNVATIAGLEPGRRRTAVFNHRDRKLGAVLVIPPEGPTTPELTMILKPWATITGRLVDGQGKPVRGSVRVNLPTGNPEVYAGIQIADVRVDAEGRFRIDNLPPGGRYVVSASSNHSYGFGQMTPEAFEGFKLATDLSAEPGAAIELGTFDVKAARRIDAPAPKNTEPAEVPITGRIVDLEGRPVAALSVRIEHVWRAKNDDLTDWLDSVKKGEPAWIAGRHLEYDKGRFDRERVETTTDGEGRFRLEGVGGEQVVSLKLQGDTIAVDIIQAVTRRTEPIAARGFPSSYGSGTQSIRGAEFTYTARMGRPVEGVVLDETTKEPMAGVTIESYRMAGSTFVQTSTLKTVSDARGRFRLVGMPKGKDNMVLAVPNDDQPYLQREFKVDDPPGIAPVSISIGLHRGIWITGKVTDRATGAPAQNARLHYLPFLTNTNVQGLPEFASTYHVHGNQLRYQSRADGTFRLVGMPGRAIVGVENDDDRRYRTGVGSDGIEGIEKNGYFKTYGNPVFPGRLWPNSMKEINPAAGTESVSLDLELDPGLSVRMKVVDADGAPVSGCSAAGWAHRGGWRTFAEAEFAALNFAPGQERTLVVRHDGRKLGKVVRIKPGADATGPVVVALAPLAAISGRAIDADGNPVAAARVRPDFEPSGDFSPHLPEVVSGPDGRFVVPDVPTGCGYTLFVESGRSSSQRRSTFVKVKVEPSSVADIGDVKFAGR